MKSRKRIFVAFLLNITFKFATPILKFHKEMAMCHAQVVLEDTMVFLLFFVWLEHIKLAECEAHAAIVSTLLL